MERNTKLMDVAARRPSPPSDESTQPPARRHTRGVSEFMQVLIFMEVKMIRKTQFDVHVEVSKLLIQLPNLGLQRSTI